MKVMTIDDSSIVRKIIKNAAEVLEYEVIEAKDGYEAMEQLKENYETLNLILLDWNMPGPNGLEVLKSIKANEKYKRIPIMMVTTEGEKSNIIEAIKNGASHYMMKPFTMDELIKKMLECIGKGGA